MQAEMAPKKAAEMRHVITSDQSAGGSMETELLVFPLLSESLITFFILYTSHSFVFLSLPPHKCSSYNSALRLRYLIH